MKAKSYLSTSPVFPGRSGNAGSGKGGGSLYSARLRGDCGELRQRLTTPSSASGRGNRGRPGHFWAGTRSGVGSWPGNSRFVGEVIPCAQGHERTLGCGDGTGTRQPWQCLPGGGFPARERWRSVRSRTASPRGSAIALRPAAVLASHLVIPRVVFPSSLTGNGDNRICF